jgi:dipeptidase E
MAAPIAAQIVVSGGGSFWTGPEGLALDRWALSLTGRQKPRVCYLATASGDHPGFIEPFYDRLGPFCEPSHLPLFLPPYRDPAEALRGQDLVYVCGGSTANLLAVWRRHGIDQLLRDAVDRGTILYGASAGGLCWFDGGVTDSLGFDDQLRPLTDGLGFLAGSHCPHLDHAERLDAYVAMVEDGSLADGVGVHDHAAVRYVGGAVAEVVLAAEGANAVQVARSPSGPATITPLPAIEL